MDNAEIYKTTYFAIPDAQTNPDIALQAALGSERMNSKQEAGDYSSANFKTGVSGWRLRYNGDFEACSGTFRGTLTGNTITGATINGALIQTATSGARIRITSASATTPTQSANSIAFIDGGNNILAFIGTGYQLGAILSITPASDVTGGYFLASTGIVLTSHLVNIFMQDATSSGRALSVAHAGTGTAAYILSSGTGVGLHIIDGTTTSSADTAFIESYNSTSNALHIIRNSSTNGAGYALYIEHLNTTTNTQAVYIRNSGASVGLYIDQLNSSGALVGLNVVQRTPQIAAASFQGALSSSHFYKVITIQGYNIWASDGTTPNGNLGGNFGDLCIGANAGPFWNNNGSTGWTAF